MNIVWPNGSLRSPTSGATLRREGDILIARGEAWPVVEEIPFLRSDRPALVADAVAALRRSDKETATILLLGDQDGWARTSPPDERSRRDLLRDVDAVTFRDAMDALAFGPVATYFQHRWSDPTFLSGLALGEAHWQNDARVFELACGAGHFLREFARVTNDVAGADLVFAKLWLARRFVAPKARLVCFDASAPWPMLNASADLVFCHDAFYFLDAKPNVAAEMRRVAGDGSVLIGHAHNAAVDNLSSGAPLLPGEYANLFGESRLYDDNELTSALIEMRAPIAARPDALLSASAIAIATGAAARAPVRAVTGGLAMPPEGARLRRNPLYVDGRIAWPSDRYAREYGPLATYPETVDAPPESSAHDFDARRRVFVDLPPRW